jgi:hypothetical protein
MIKPKKKPILFSTDMVRAILDGKKTMTRRVIKPQPLDDYGQQCGPETIIGPEWYEPAETDKNGMLIPGAPIFGIYHHCDDWGIKCPYIPGEIRWVRETFARYIKDGQQCYLYRADDNDCNVAKLRGSESADDGWRPSIFMPKEVARIFLLVKDVRAERVQDITEEDAEKEGAHFHVPVKTAFVKERWEFLTARTKFCSLWDSINAKRGYGWDTNPYIWAISFERITKEEAYREAS